MKLKFPLSPILSVCSNAPTASPLNSNDEESIQSNVSQHVLKEPLIDFLQSQENSKLRKQYYVHLSVSTRSCKEPECLWQKCFTELGDDLIELYQLHRTARTEYELATNKKENQKHSALLEVANPKANIDALRYLLERLDYAPEDYSVYWMGERALLERLQPAFKG